jgi:hypothetical protein
MQKIQLLQVCDVAASHVGDLVAAVHLQLLQVRADAADDFEGLVTDLQAVVKIQLRLQVNFTKKIELKDLPALSIGNSSETRHRST